MKKLFSILILLGAVITYSKAQQKTTEVAEVDGVSASSVKIPFDNVHSPYVMVSSNLSSAEIIKNLKSGIADKNLTIFNEISHHEGAKKIGQELQFTHVVVFGNPKIGSKLMQCDQRIGIELPLKVLVITSTTGESSILYTNPQHYKQYFYLDECKEILNKMEKVMKQLTSSAATNALE